MRKIYVSSTFVDLKGYRERVSNVIRLLGDLDVAMEHYAAEDMRPVDRCLTDVAECDVYVGIFAWRYGFVPTTGNPEQLSITELEYGRAEELKKPRLIFLLNEDAPWSPKLIDKDRTQIEQLRSRVSGAVVARFFTTEDSLAAEVSASLAKMGQGSGAAPSFATLDVEKYFSALRQRYGHLDLDALTGAQRDEFLQLQLQSVYIEQHVRESSPPVELSKDLEDRLLRSDELHAEDFPEGVTKDLAKSLRDFHEKYPARPVIEVLGEPEKARAIILGHPGSGKSTLSRYLILSLIDPAGDPTIRDKFPRHLPIVIELKSYVALRRGGKCDTFLDFLGRMGETEGWGLSRDAVVAYLQSRQPALVIFDGLDEIFEPAERETITRQIVGFASDFPSARIVATSRVLGYRRTILANAGFVQLTLQDFESEQVEAFAKKWFAIAMPNRGADAEERVARITRAYNESPSIRQLAGVPMLLTIMAIIGKNQELPRERWKLYDHAAGVLVQHWDVNKHLREQKLEADFLLEDDKKDLLRRLAWRMQSAKGGLAGNYIHRGDLLAEFESYLHERFAQDAERAARIAREMVEQFWERNYILSTLGANVYGFVHRAFLEYFCADAIVYRFEKTNTLSLQQLKEEIFGAHYTDRTWHEVLRLVCGKVGEQFAGAMIAHLLDCGAIGFSVECLSEIRNVSAIGETAERVADKWFDMRVTDLSPSSNALPAESAPWALRWLTKPHTSSIEFPWGIANELTSAAHGSNDIYAELEQLAINEGHVLQAVAIIVLARGYQDRTNTRTLLEAIAIEASDALVRSVACFEIISCWQDGSVIDFAERMSSDEYPAVRAEVAEALGGSGILLEEGTETVRTVTEIMVRLATHDSDDDVRSRALRVLAYTSSPHTDMLRDRAQNDSSSRIRAEAREHLVMLGQMEGS